MKLTVLFYLVLFGLPSRLSAAEINEGEMAGYLFGPAEKAPEEFNAGFSLYAAAGPLVAAYPGHRFQTGLCGTWMPPQPGPKAGPFKAKLGDGSVVTYYWYRFADQPVMLNADLTDKKREQVRARVEKPHRTWTKDRNYLTPPDVGTLASIDPALILTPPEGLELGYMSIASRQELE